MQTQTQIRQLLAEAGLAPNKALGQNFLVDQNLLASFLDLAGVRADDVVLEVGPGTGTLTEELVQRALRVVAVEIDRGLHSLLARRLAGRANLTLLHADALAGKHEIAPAVLEALGPRARLVSNLPYGAATPLVIECLLTSWRADHSSGLARDSSGSPTAQAGRAGTAGCGGRRCLFESLTFTVQREVADRMSAGPGSDAYGPLSVVVALLGKVREGPIVPAAAFWPRPNVASRMLRIDFDARAARRVASEEVLTALLRACFAQRRKQLGSLLRRAAMPFPAEALAAAFAEAGVALTDRAERVRPEQFRAVVAALAGGRQGPGTAATAR